MSSTIIARKETGRLHNEIVGLSNARPTLYVQSVCLSLEATRRGLSSLIAPFTRSRPGRTRTDQTSPLNVANLFRKSLAGITVRRERGSSLAGEQAGRHIFQP